MEMGRVALVIGCVGMAAGVAAAEGWEQPPKVHPDFRVERVYEVPREKGSWIGLTIDSKGRFIASDQKGALYRITVSNDQPVLVESIDLNIGFAHGLLWAFKCLYVVVAEDRFDGPGLYRLRDANGDGGLDSAQLLRAFEGTGEHGPHSVVLAPDGRSLLVVAGNKTRFPSSGGGRSMVPDHWGEDDLLPRIWGPIGSEAGTPAPGGWVAQTDPDGRAWRLLAVGLRNSFDLAHDRSGELFTVDADAEFDMGTPWYQPTRVFHLVPGTDYGWRSGSGKWPPFYADTLPPVLNLGPGSPTGVTFAHNAKFSSRYQNALFIGDWSLGRIIAVHLKPNGAGYQGEFESIVSGTPLPVADLVVRPNDGAMYFITGGRGTNSSLYRLTQRERMVGRRSHTAHSPTEDAQARTIRGTLESLYHADQPQAAIVRAWPYLGHPDRVIRHVARIVLEHHPSKIWRSQGLSEPDPQARLTALLALARAGPATDHPALIDAMLSLDFEKLSRGGRLHFVRCLEVALIRMGTDLDDSLRERLLHTVEARFPTGDDLLDGQLCKVLVFLKSERTTSAAVQLMSDALIQEQRLRFALPLRHQQAGWNPKLRLEFFSTLAGTDWKGGRSLTKYVEQIGKDALSRVNEPDRQRYIELLQRPHKSDVVPPAKRKHVRNWTLAELLPIRRQDLEDRDQERGRRVFAEVKCFSCHRFQQKGGGAGPDLTTVAKRLSPENLLEAIVDPSKVVSDQFAAATILTADGRIVTGRVVNLVGQTLMIQTDMLDSSKLLRLERTDVERIKPSKTSMMPAGLLDTLTRWEILDLLAYLLAGEYHKK